MNTHLFDGLLAMEEIKVYEDDLEQGVYAGLPQEELDQFEGNYKEKKRTARGCFQLSN
jgi:hypothetical protein